MKTVDTGARGRCGWLITLLLLSGSAVGFAQERTLEEQPEERIAQQGGSTQVVIPPVEVVVPAQVVRPPAVVQPGVAVQPAEVRSPAEVATPARVVESGQVLRAEVVVPAAEAVVTPVVDTPVNVVVPAAAARPGVVAVQVEAAPAPEVLRPEEVLRAEVVVPAAEVVVPARVETPADVVAPAAVAGAGESAVPVEAAPAPQVVSPAEVVRLEEEMEEPGNGTRSEEVLRPVQVIMTPQVVRTPEEIMLPDELRERQEQPAESVVSGEVGEEAEPGPAAPEEAEEQDAVESTGQVAEAEEVEEVEVIEEVPEVELPKIETSWATRTEARALRLRIPAPRGQIVDAEGYPLVQNRVAYRLGLKLPFVEGGDEQVVLASAREGLAVAGRILEQDWTLEDEVILKHYEHRRWLPLLFSGTLTEDQRLKVEDAGEEAEGLVLHPFYERFYPHGEFAPHVLGAIGKEIKIPTGPIADMDPIFEITKGRFGLEAAFNEELTGDDGRLNILYDTDGSELSREIVDRPVPGKSLVTTLNVHYQRYAEASLAKHAKGGAMVVIDARGGDILAMASYPNFDPGIWVDGLSAAQWESLKDDPRTPLYAKTFQGSYPPASTFKTVIALAALESGRVSRTSLFPCPTSMVIGDRVFRNWNKDGEGMLNVVDAIKRSCNTWFYRVALDTGSDSVLGMARELGFGQPVGLPIEGEIFGALPSNEVQRKRYGFGIRGGDLANIAIGQGSVLATPLQVARAMAAVGTGEYLSKLRLVKQVQDIDDNIVRSYPPPAKTPLPVSQASLDLVREGMVAVISGSGGTGRRAAIRQAQMAGKTGTAQWDLAKNRNLAWFAGFVPAINPRFAFAALYEGDPGEKVSGGAKAAPIVHDVFRRIYARLEVDSRREYEELTEEAPVVEVQQVPVAVPEQVVPLAPPPPLPPMQVPPEREGFFKRFFRRR